MGRYIRVETDVPGLDRLEELIVEHKHLLDLLENNASEIRKSISQYNMKVKVEETIEDDK